MQIGKTHPYRALNFYKNGGFDMLIDKATTRQKIQLLSLSQH
jgi:hypothetical protein